MKTKIRVLDVFYVIFVLLVYPSNSIFGGIYRSKMAISKVENPTLSENHILDDFENGVKDYCSDSLQDYHSILFL